MGEYLKAKLKKNGGRWVSATSQLKLLSPDGKRYKTDVVDADGVKELAKIFPNKQGRVFS